jgi:hypothetical protein
MAENEESKPKIESSPFTSEFKTAFNQPLKDVTGILTTQLDIVSAMNTMENAVTNLSMKFGGMRGLSQSIKETINESTVSVQELGGTIEDVVKIQEGVIKGLQTQTILNSDAYADLYAAGNLVNDGTKTNAEVTKKMVSEFVNAGYGLNNVSKEMTGIINQARTMGVITSAVYGEVTKNMGKLALFNFENGVQGMAKMAAQAASLRIDMGKSLELADKLFSPEAAIDMAASFQRLGVQVSSLLDPYKLMDMARNDPAKLQESIIEATKSLTYFDEKNQKMAILPGAQATLRELAKQAGYSNEEFAKMALNAGDLERKLKEIRFSPNVADEGTKNLIANMAQMSKDGKSYEITFDEIDTEGVSHKVTKAVSDLSEDNIKSIQEMSKPGLSAVELQKQGNNTLVQLHQDLLALRGVMPRAVAASPQIAQLQKAAAEKATPFVRGLRETVGVQERRTESGVLFSDTKKITDSMNEVTNKTKEFMEQVLSGQITKEEGEKKFKEMIESAGTGFQNSVRNFQTNYQNNQTQPQTTQSPVTTTRTTFAPVPVTTTNPFLRQQDYINNQNQNQPLTTAVQNNIASNVTETKDININIKFSADSGDLENILNKSGIKQQIVQIVTDVAKENSNLRGTGSVTSKIGL